MPALRSRIPSVPKLLALAMAAAAALLLYETRGQTLLFDEWSFFADYRGHSLGTLLNPFGGNLELLPILLYKAIFTLFGPDSVALRLALVALGLSGAGLFFVLARRRVGDWVALAAASLLLVLGAAADVVAATLGIAILMSVAFGLGALVALEREDELGDRLACALLVGAVASNSAGLPFVVGAAVDVLVVRGGEWRRRLWVFGVPVVLYGIWRIWSAHLDPLGPLATHPSTITVSNLGTLPSSVAESLSSAAVSVTGLFRSPGAEGSSFSTAFGPALAVAFGFLAVLRLRYGPPVGKRIWVFVAMPLSYWVLIALVLSDRQPDLSRYQYAGSIFLLLAAFELARGLPRPRWAEIAAAAVFVVAMGPNLINLHQGSNFLRINGELNRAELTAVEAAGSKINDRVMVEPVGGRLLPGSETKYVGSNVPTTDIVISAQRYLDAAGAYGSAAFSPSELARQRPYLRQAYEQELRAVLGK